MPAEGRGNPDRAGVAEEHSFDELAKELARRTVSRRRALKLVGAALLGGVFSFLALPGVAVAKKRRRRRFACSTCATTEAPPADQCCYHVEGRPSGCLVRQSACAGSVPPGTGCICS